MDIFVGRVRELRWFREVMGEQHTYPFLLYGPLGCGKTTLAQKVAERAEELFGDVVVLYINARAKRARNALFTNAVQWLKEALSKFAKAAAGEVGEFLARTAVDIALYFVEKTSKDILLVVDEFHRAYRDDPVGWVKYYMDLMEHPSLRDEELRNITLNVVLITSEYTAVEKILPKGYADPYMVWNLAREERALRRPQPAYRLRDAMADMRRKPQVRRRLEEGGLGRGEVRKGHRQEGGGRQDGERGRQARSC
ncbi:ATP-binding protein [Pyrobaculum islandicum]|uniref:ATP-binding protein n=1 Tax=Pyrobaculum islandicum TaxID=2277 RepID=UPI000AEF96FA|nr:ATP-binding protein [Pyrobaculum islandicum]